jgi:Zn finger protein HypA/HybF involved in hydrogenase expression
MSDKPVHIACAECGQTFTIIENWPLEQRCPPCQAQYRIQEASTND